MASSSMDVGQMPKWFTQARSCSLGLVGLGFRVRDKVRVRVSVRDRVCVRVSDGV